jgi:hypothetical protein
MKSKRAQLFLCLVLLGLFLIFRQPDYVVELTCLSDPAELATLGARGANPRLKKAVYWLDEARARGVDMGGLIDKIQARNKTPAPHAALVKTNLLRNVKIGDELGFFTPENRELLSRGNAPIVMSGPYKGQRADVDHIIPFSVAPELGNDFGNLELMPQSLNQKKKDKVGDRQRALARQFFQAGVIDAPTLERILQAR